MSSKDPATFTERSRKLTEAFARAEKHLGNGPFFNGDALGNVDIAWLVLLHRAHIIEAHSGHDMLANFPKVKRWQDALMETGIPQKSVAAEFAEKFHNFYLSDSTWLGRGANLNEAPCAPSKSSGGGCCG